MKPHSITDKATVAKFVILVLWSLISTSHLLADTGAQIYQKGISQSGSAFIGHQKSQAPSSLFPCINCHGQRGAGSKESGVSAPDVTWSQLTQAYRKDPDGGKPRAPYTRQSFKRLLLSGINSDGKSLSDSMPRYDLDDREVNALIEYLQNITLQRQRGITADTIHFWLRLPDNQPLADAMFNTVSSFIESVNEQGGIYRRQLRLQDFPADQAEKNAFGVIDLRLLEQQQNASDHISLGIFKSRGSGDNAYFLYPHPADLDTMQSKIAAQNNWRVLSAGKAALDDLLAKRSADNDRFTILTHLNEQMPIEQLLSTLQQAQRYPRILLNSLSLSTTQHQAIQLYPAPVYVLTPPGPESVSAAGQTQYSQLASQAGWSNEQLRARLWSLALMRLLETVLEQSGKNISEQLFADTLQRQVDLQTDFGPMLSFSPTRRIGNSDAILIPLN